MKCALCERVKLTEDGSYPYLIHEFKHSYLYLGEHQFYKGYCILVTKNHFREMTDIPKAQREELFEEMMLAYGKILNVFKPKKMNMCSLGNVVDHVHWHFFPRYADDKDFKNPPWLQMDQFESIKPNETERINLIKVLRAEFN